MATCTAHAKTTGRQCGQRAIPGGTVCRFHGGKAPQVRAAALRRTQATTALQWAAGELERLGMPDRDPLEHLEACLAEDARTYALWALACETLVTEGDDLLGEDKHEQRTIHPYVTERNLAAQRWSQTSKRALDAGVSQRRIEIRETEARMYSDATRSMLAALGLSQELQARGVAILGAQLRRLGPPDIQQSVD